MKRKKMGYLLIALVAVCCVLSTVVFANAKDNRSSRAFLDEIEKKLKAFKPNSKYRDDRFALVVLQEAIVAVKEGNYGVGACLVREPDGKVIQKGHNRVFKPYFRSDLHAEMDAINRYEDSMRGKKSNIEKLVLYTSLEPGPMGLTRMITSGIRKCFYLAPDPQAGMVHSMGNLPSLWQEIAKGREYRQAECSPELINYANEIFLYSREFLDKKLKER